MTLRASWIGSLAERDQLQSRTKPSPKRVNVFVLVAFRFGEWMSLCGPCIPTSLAADSAGKLIPTSRYHQRLTTLLLRNRERVCLKRFARMVLRFVGGSQILSVKRSFLYYLNCMKRA